jgi:hypothetical protein
MGDPWLLISVSTRGASSTLRVHAWRRLRALGAHYLQQSVCVLPERPHTTRAIGRLLARVKREGGQVRVLHIQLLDEHEEASLIAAFSAERSDEYREVVARTDDFLGEIAMERGRGRATYTEVAESDADLKRLQRWLSSIRQRDYFDAAGYAEAVAALERCERALAEFEADAYASELEVSAEEAPAGRRLRAIGEGDDG